MPTNLFDNCSVALKVSLKSEVKMNSISEYRDLKANDKEKTVIESTLKKEDTDIRVGLG